MPRHEFLTRRDSESRELSPGFHVRVLANGALGAEALTTCLATADPGATLPYHTHPTGEVITGVVGGAEVMVEGRFYKLAAYDAIYVPPGVAHGLRNATDHPVVVHTTFPTGQPERDFIDQPFPEQICETTDDSVPETLVRFATAETYELGSGGTEVRDLFAARLGAAGVCGGYGKFQPGASLPCHTHRYDESITIVEGVAVCQVAGNEYELSDCDNACIPTARPHRFLNRGDRPMVMIWVYAGDEPDRELVDAEQCEGC